jgi:hypothetical protein
VVVSISHGEIFSTNQNVSGIEINVGLMCNCLIVLKPMVRVYGNKLGSFFVGNSGMSNQLSGSKPTGGLNSKNRRKNGSHQLGSIDKAIGKAGPEEEARRTSKDEIVVAQTYIVEQMPSDDEISKGGREFGAESEEDIVLKVKRYSKQ